MSTEKEDSCSTDTKYMLMANELAELGRITAPPNPWVGCLIVNKGQIVGKGFHQKAGDWHAEIYALHEAKDRAKGSTAYITLEPCSHFGRTPPCVSSLINAGISRVVIGIEDPDPRVSGQGIQALVQAGVQVSCGIESEKISQSLAPYLHHRKNKLPYCVGKAAISIDGRLAAADGTSQWLTSETVRQNAHQVRAESQAIMIGVGTALFDQPRLTVRDVSPSPLSPPLRIILDTRGRLNPPSPLFDLTLAPTLIMTTIQCPTEQLKKWKSLGIEVEILNMTSCGLINLREALQILEKRNIVQILIEGGGKLLASFIEEKLLHHLILYISPCILGSKGHPIFNLDSISTLNSAYKLSILRHQRIEESLRLDYRFL